MVHIVLVKNGENTFKSDELGLVIYDEFSASLARLLLSDQLVIFKSKVNILRA